MNLFVAGFGEAGADAAAAERALRGLVERLPFFDESRIRSWGSADGHAAAAGVSHPPEQTGGVEYTLFEPERMALWSGRPIRWSSEGDADGRAALDPAFYLERPAAQWSSELDGRSTAVRYADGAFEVYSDALGAYPLFETEVDGTHWISNNAEVLRSLRGTHELDAAVLASLLGGGWSLSGDPLWAGVRRTERGRGLLPPERIAAMPGAGFDAERAAALLTESVRALADWPGRPNIVPVTGGRDSRLVLAAALAAGIGFEVRTGGEPGMPDVEVARELAQRAGVEHSLLEHDPHGSVTNDWERAAELVALTSSGTASLADAAGYPLGPREGPLWLWHSGQGGEIARAYYGLGEGLDRNGLADRLYRSFVGRRPGRQELLSDQGRRSVQREIRAFVDEQLDAGVQPVDVPDMFYLLKRMGTWAGPGHGCVEYVRDTTSPLWSPRLLPELLGLPARERAREQFHRQVLERLAPELVDVPFERGETWPAERSAARARLDHALSLAAKAGGEATRRARGGAARVGGLVRRGGGEARADSFAPVLAGVRERVLADSGHEAWEVLDRARVERLLTREPASLDTMSRYYVWRLGTVFG